MPRRRSTWQVIDALQSNCASDIVHRRGNGYQFSDSLNYRVGIFQAVPGDCANYTTRVGNFLEWVRGFACIAAFEQPGDRCRAGRFDKDSLIPSQPTLRSDDLFVAHCIDRSQGFGDGGARLFPACRVPDSNCGRNRFRFLDDSIMKNRRRPSRLKSNHHWQFRRVFTCKILPISRPIGCNVSGVANWEQMKIGRVAQFIDNLERGSLLPCDPVRIDRIYNDEVSALAELAHDSKSVIKISVDRYNFRAVNESLQ